MIYHITHLFQPYFELKLSHFFSQFSLHFLNAMSTDQKPSLIVNEDHQSFESWTEKDEEELCTRQKLLTKAGQFIKQYVLKYQEKLDDLSWVVIAASANVELADRNVFICSSREEAWKLVPEDCYCQRVDWVKNPRILHV
jgi:hypothetical protein